jgi:hypothetical protein
MRQLDMSLRQPFIRPESLKYRAKNGAFISFPRCCELTIVRPNDSSIPHRQLYRKCITSGRPKEISDAAGSHAREQMLDDSCCHNGLLLACRRAFVGVDLLNPWRRGGELRTWGDEAIRQNYVIRRRKIYFAKKGTTPVL